MQKALTELCAPLLVIAMPLWLWPRAPLPPGLPVNAALPPAPSWGAWSDLVLDGPDAAEWAINSQRMAAGAFELLDRHRMPSWLLLVSAVMRTGMDVVTAGHFVNRCMFLVAVLATYLLGRLSSGVLAGVLAATLVLADQHLGLGVQRFGIDAAIEAMLPLGIALAFLTRERWWLGLPAGLGVGWVVLLHQTALPFVVPAVLVALLVGGPGWRRFAGAGALLVGVALVFGSVSRIFPFPTLAQIVQDVNEGANPGAGNDAAAAADTAAMLRTTLSTGVNDAYVRLWAQMSGWIAPIKYLVPFGILGIFAPFLRVPALWPAALNPPVEPKSPPPVPEIAPPAPESAPSRWARVRGFLWELAHNSSVGLALLTCLAPLPFLAAAHAPTRYGENLLPFAAVLLARGMGTVACALQRAVAAILPPWPALRIGEWLVGALLAVAAAYTTTQLVAARGLTRARLSDESVGSLLLASALSEAFADGTKVACPMSEALLLTKLESCRAQPCPLTPDEPAVVACLQTLARTCGTRGTLAYVVLPGHQMYDPKARGRPALDAWIAERVPAQSSVQIGEFSALIYSVPAEITGGL